MPNSEKNQNADHTVFQKDESSRIEIRDHITRENVRAEKDKIFLFGDNLAGKGSGGQAKEMRGEENSVGIPTKKAPSNSPGSFFTDQEFAANMKAIDEAFGKIPPDKTIVIPKAGLGTGLANLAEKAPKTFAYLNEKLAHLGFNNQTKEISQDLTAKNLNENKVILQKIGSETPTAKRLLDLDNINTRSLKNLSPTEKEIDTLKSDPEKALGDYADRLRSAYKTNQGDFRAGLKLLSNSLEKGAQINIVCSCRESGAMCHADVVKMAVEKVNAYLKNERIDEKNKNEITESRSIDQGNSKIQPQNLNPRTQRAVNEILSFSENDRLLEKINETDGRNRSEQASYLGQSSQFVRDLYERGSNVVDGNLIVPQEKLSVSAPPVITTQNYAVERLSKILHDEEKAKNLAPVVVEYGNKIAGVTADGETKLKVFGWVYDSLEGKDQTSARDESKYVDERSNFEQKLEQISILANEMHSLEPLDKIEFVPLAGGIEQSEIRSSVFEHHGESLDLEEIYEDSLSLREDEKSAHSLDSEAGKINTDAFERLDLGFNVPRIPKDYTGTEIAKLIAETLPEIDRQLETGITPKEILNPYHQAVWQSAREDAQNRLESIYQKQKINGTENLKAAGKAIDKHQSQAEQLGKIDLRRQNVIEIKHPGEYLEAEKQAVQTFYRQQKQEVGNLLTKIDEVREKQVAGEKSQEIALKKELTTIREAKPNFAFKLENSDQLVVGMPSTQSIETRNFISSYLSYQIQQPETRLRSLNGRYRNYAAKLESAATREDVMKFSSGIRAENAALGLTWKDLGDNEKAKLSQPLTSKEMQFLFTETSPAHYTNEMTATRLSYAHTGTSRRLMTESLLKGEISPSPEARKLIESLESRLQRREFKDALLATRHFYSSLKTPSNDLKYQNSFNHRAIYQKLPPAERDFVYRRATQQKENLEYRIAFKQHQFDRQEEIKQTEQSKPEMSQAEKSFHLNSRFNQAQILAAKLEQPTLGQKEISELNVLTINILLKNQPLEKLEYIAREFQKSEKSEHKKIGEVIQTFSRAEISGDENKKIVSIKLPENKLVGVETYRELLEKFYPDYSSENTKYKFAGFGDKEVSRALNKGQDQAIINIQNEIKINLQSKEVSATFTQTEQAIGEKLDKIGQFQAAARLALTENKSILQKYLTRTTAKINNLKHELPSLNSQKAIVEFALGGKAPALPSTKAHDQFLQAVQKEITISDSDKFIKNESILSEMKAGIKSEFTGLSQDLKLLEEHKLSAPRILESGEKEEKALEHITEEKHPENKPLTLKIFEKELERAEKQILGEKIKEKLSAHTDLEKERDFQPADIFSSEERVSIKEQAFEKVKEKLEPKELGANNQKISPEAGRQAFITYKQFERASHLFQFSNDKHKIRDAFSKLDIEAAALNKIRQDYGKSEKISLLHEGIKADLIKLFHKNVEQKSIDTLEQTKEIVSRNFHKTGFVEIAGDSERIIKLSREIGGKLEAKQLFAVKDKQILLSAESKERQNSGKILEAATEKIKPKFEQAKDSFVRSR